MEMRNAHTISTLLELIAVSDDAEKGFCTCAGHAHEEAIRVLLENCATTCANNAQELRALLRQLDGASALQRQTGTAQRGWNNLQISVTDDAALLEECERCEAYTLEMYRNALDDHLPDFLRRILLRQFIKIMRNQDRVRARSGHEPRPARRANTGS